MLIVKKKKFPEVIISYTKQKNATVLVVDKETTVRFLDQESLDILGGFKAKINHQWYKNKVVDFSYDGLHFAVITEDAKQSKLYDTATKKAKIKINRHQGEVTCVAIDPKGRYFFSGGEDGRTFVSDIKSAKLLFTLPTHVDTINDIVFSKKNHLVATASYDKKIQIFNYATMEPLARFAGHSAAVMKLDFLHNNRLCSVDKDANVIIWDLEKKKLLKRLTGIHDDVVQITSNDTFLFLGTALGFVIVYHLQTHEQVSRKYIKVNSRITCLDYDVEQELLVIADESGELLYFDVYQGIKDIQTYIHLKNYAKVYQLVQENPLLVFTDTYKKLDEIWNDDYKKASQLLQKSKKEEAVSVIKAFTSIPSKNTQIQKLFKDYEAFEKFLLLVQKGNLGLAYSLANQYPVYKESEVYKALERKWKKLFLKAQKMSLDPRKKDLVKELLAPYRGIVDKTKHIQEMLVKNDIYTRFKDSIIRKEFKHVFELIKVNPFLKEFPEFSALNFFADSLYIKITKLIREGDIHQSTKLLNVLIDFPEFTKEAQSMLWDIEMRDKFYDAIKSSNYLEIYKIIDTSTALSETPEGTKYSNLWHDDLDLAKVYAAKGDIRGIDGVLSKYKNIPSKFISIASTYALAYIAQIEHAISKKKDSNIIKNAIKNYLLYFGSDDHIISSIEIFNKKYKLSVDIQTMKKSSKKQWRPSMRVLDILE